MNGSPGPSRTCSETWTSSVASRSGGEGALSPSHFRYLFSWRPAWDPRNTCSGCGCAARASSSSDVPELELVMDLVGYDDRDCSNGTSGVCTAWRQAR
jgi:hypothetical protein